MVQFRSSLVLALVVLNNSLSVCDAFAPTKGTSILQQQQGKTISLQQQQQQQRSSVVPLNALFGTTTTTTTTTVDPLYNRHAASDWFYNMRSFPQSKVLREIRNPVLSATAWSFVVSVVHRLCAMSSNAFLNSIAAHMSIPGTAHSFLVSALGLLLVFRTNSAYQRFNVSL